MRSRALICVTSAIVVVGASCAFPWDDFDPRLGEEANGGMSSSDGGASAGGTTSTGGDGGATTGGGATGGNATGGGGATGECVGEQDGTLCGSMVDTDCDPLDQCVLEVCDPKQAADGSSCDDCTGGFCNGCSAGVCQSCVVSAEDLETIFSNNGQADGIMFDVEALERLKITGFSLNLVGGFNGTIEVYTNPGGHVGDEETASAWSLVAQNGVTSVGSDMPTFMSMATNTIEMGPGETLGIYITTTSSGTNQQLYFTQGTLGSTAATDGNLEIKYGQRLTYPFMLLSAVKLWNGRVHYDLCQ